MIFANANIIFIFISYFMTCDINMRSFYRLIVYYINKNIYCKSSAIKSLMEFWNLNSIKIFMFPGCGTRTHSCEKTTECLFLIFVNANVFFKYSHMRIQLDVDPQRDDDASPMSTCRCMLRPTWIISALKHKSKYKSNSISNLFEKKKKSNFLVPML